MIRNLYPLGTITDEGDTLLQVRRLVKGKRFGLIWKLGPVRDTVPADRVAGTSTPSTEGAPDVMADLHADKKVTLSVQATDEMGNPTTFDATAWTVAYTADDPDGVLNLTDNGDGTAVAAAVGTLGAALVTATLTKVADGSTATGVLAIQVIAGDAESFVVVAGAEEEVTPDV